MAEFVRISNWSDGPSNTASSGAKLKSKLSLVASIPKSYTEKAIKRVASMDHNIFNLGTAIDVGWFLLKMTALDMVRRVSKAYFPFAWQGLQALQLLSYPPFKWIQKWSPFKFLVQCMQVRVSPLFNLKFCMEGKHFRLDRYVENLSKPLLILSIATSLPDQSNHTEDTSRRPSDDLEERRDSQSDTATDISGPDSRSAIEVYQSAATEKWISKLLAELEKEGITLPERINEEELHQFYDAANGDFSCFLSSIKKTIRWRHKFKFLSVEELEDWSTIVFWHGRDRCQRPCLIIRLGPACSDKIPDHRSRFPEVVVSQVEHGVLNLVDASNPQITVLMDCEGLAPFRFPMQMMRSCTILLQDHYPTRLAALFVLRLPPVGRVIAHTLFQVLRPGTRQKLRIEGDKYKQVLSEFLETLPSFLGGDCTCSICSVLIHDTTIPVEQEGADAVELMAASDSPRIEELPSMEIDTQINDDVGEIDNGGWRILKLVVVSFVMLLCIVLTLKNGDLYNRGSGS